MDKPYLYIWNFKVPAENEVEFQKKYGPEGDWVELFRKAEGQRTLLLKNLDLPGWYTSIDMWESRKAFDIFREQFTLEFEKLDMLCESLTEIEVCKGRFEML